MYDTESGNAERMRNGFREEAGEILAELESALLKLQQNPDDDGLLGAIFRGLHTLKGSGAMFGFDTLAAFVHDLESAFDQVRGGRLKAGSELIDLTLSALDHVPGLLAEDENRAAESESVARAELLGKVRQLARIPEPVKDGKDARPIPAEGSATQEEEKTQDWRIYFAPAPELMRSGANPLLLLRELRQLGNLSVTASAEAVPALKELDPERCYVSWHMDLRTAEGLDAIRDVFIFVEDECELSIEAVESGEAAQEETPVSSESGDKSGALVAGRPESPISRAHEKHDIVSSLRVPAAKLDRLVNLVGEMVSVQAHLSEVASRRDDPEIAAVSEEIERLTSALRDNSMNIRMVPIRSTFEKFRRLVHDLARDLRKEVELTIEGADTELDKTVIEQLGEPVMHLIRNSMDHGIEAPEVRAARGKPPTARVHLSARYAGASVLIGVSDDGAGIDATKVRQRAVERGLVAADADLTESEVFALIFRPGFSTAQQVTDVSGRGVGMDVVHQKVESLRGTIEVTSKPGEGTRVTLRLPLTLAIIEGLLVSVAEAWFVLPLAATLECVELTRAEIERNGRQRLAHVRGEIIPYIRLRDHFGISGATPEIEQIMLVETSLGRYGFAVDRVVGNLQTVIKPLGRFYRHVQTVSGATILGDGNVALILDPERLVQDSVRGASHAPRGQPAARSQ